MGTSAGSPNLGKLVDRPVVKYDELEMTKLGSRTVVNNSLTVLNNSLLLKLTFVEGEFK